MLHAVGKVFQALLASKQALPSYGVKQHSDARLFIYSQIQIVTAYSNVHSRRGHGC